MVVYRNPGPIEFDAVLERQDVSNSQAYVSFPHRVEELYGVSGRVPVRASFDGAPYRGSLVTYGNGHLILVLRRIRESIGKEPGDVVRVRIELDTEERVVELADDVVSALTGGGQLDAFRAMSYSHQREYHQWIEEAKRPETRARRISQTVSLVAKGERRS